MYIYDPESEENKLVTYTLRFMCRVLSMGPIPNHVAFIMDGNRRFAKKLKLEQGGGHKIGHQALMHMIRYCYELGVKYITVYAFSIDNFNRRLEEVQSVMDLMEEVIQGFLKRESIIQKYGVRVMFIGDLKLLQETVSVAAEGLMKTTAHNTNTTLLICVAYTSTNEIARGVAESCKEKWGKIETSENDNIANDEHNRDDIKVVDIEKHMYMGVAPDPDIMFRTSGETRLSNFLLWQTTNCLLYSPTALWPELGLRHFLWGLLQFQANYSYFEKKKKQPSPGVPIGDQAAIRPLSLLVVVAIYMFIIYQFYRIGFLF